MSYWSSTINMNINTTIRLTFKEGGCRQLRYGKYSSAVTKRVLTKSGKYEETIVKQSKTISEPVCENTIRTLTLEGAFVENCLRKPTKMHKRSSSRFWSGLSKRKRIWLHAEELAFDAGATLVSVEVLE